MKEKKIKVIGVIYPNLGEPDFQGDVIPKEVFKKYLDKDLTIDYYLPVRYKFNGPIVGHVIRIWIEKNNLMGEFELNQELFHIAFVAKRTELDSDRISIITNLELKEISCHFDRIKEESNAEK